ncbi:endonuclease [Mangrovibacter sp. MFB070]|uniref:sugar phosphate isomerase/epimerase family protein n=1 Tax=Mangrovibacter sp. MFB070 TaxID=1224318 RepID=UPI0004D727D1|nr:sugar phosphate isomerase/epimerase [Mangrovibacter sp. MFB070]KEA53664.1 endonuclease [Mangrovibacter sp. MFB070]
MKLGINEATCMKNSTLAVDVQLAEECGYDFIEIRLDMLRGWLAHKSLSALADNFATRHVQPWGFNSLEDITFCDATRWSSIREDMALACAAHDAVGGDCMVAVPTIRAGQHWSIRDVIADSVKRLRELSDIAGEHGMRVAFEPIGSAGCCVPSLVMAMDIVDRADRGNVGLVIDAFNLYLHDQWQEPGCLRQVPVEKIFVYHIDDADDLPVEQLDHCHRVFPGNGVIPLHAITRELVQMGYQGVCSLELFNPGYWQMPARDVFKTGAMKTHPFLQPL